MSPWRHSIRFRLASTSAAAAGMIVMVIGVCTYLMLRAGLEDETRAFALHEAEEVANLVASLSTRAEVLTRLDELERLSGERGVVALELWTLEGEPVLRLPAEGSAHASPSSEIFASARRGDRAYETFDLPGGAHSLRTALLVGGDGGPRWIVTVAVSRDRLDEALETFRSYFAFGLPAAVILTFLGSLVLVSRTLRPVQALVRDARVIAAEGPSRRLAVPPQGSELGELALLINEMLDRTEETVTRLRRFTSHAGHELRTPLARMRGEAEAALTSERQERYPEVLASVLEEIDELRETVDALLELARGEAPDHLADPPFPLAELVAQLTEEARVLGREKHITVTLESPVDVSVRGDRMLVARALWNVLANALKFTSPGGRVGLSLIREGDRIHVEVADTGPGLGTADPEHFFEPFVKGEGLDGRTGHGLGLALGRAIARRHGGDLISTSGAGGGARFRLSLPVVGAVPPVPVASAPAAI